MNRAELWARLTEAGLVSGEMPAAKEAGTPWPVRVMMGVAGWAGGLLLLVFAGLTFSMLFRSDGVALPVGIGCCLAALAAFRLGAGNDLLEQAGFAVSVAGQILICYGLVKALPGNSTLELYVAMAVVEGVLALALPNVIHRVFTVVAANVFLFLAASVAGAPALAIALAAAGAAVVWLEPEWMATEPDFWRPIGYGFAVALVHMDGSLVIGPAFWHAVLREGEATRVVAIWLGPIMAGAVLCWAAWRIGGNWTSVAMAAPLAVFGLAAPGVSAAVLILVLGFANGNRILMGLGMIAFASYLSYFYYQLDLTLLTKAGVLVGAGLVLLALRLVVRRA